MVISWSLSSRVRWWNHRTLAWWTRLHPDQCPAVAWPPRPGRGGGDQAPDFGNGQRDHAGVGRRFLAGSHRWRRLAASAVFEQGGGDGADRQSGRD